MFPGHHPSRLPPVPGTPIHIRQLTCALSQQGKPRQRQPGKRQVRSDQDSHHKTPSVRSDSLSKLHLNIQLKSSHYSSFPTAGILFRDLPQLFPIIWICFLGTSCSPGSCPSFTCVNPPATTACKWPYNACLCNLTPLSVLLLGCKGAAESWQLAEHLEACPEGFTRLMLSASVPTLSPLLLCSTLNSA